MFKKLLLAAVILAASSSIAIAATAPYVGASIGLENISNKGGSVDYRGITGNVSVGYGGIVAPNFYLAAELFGVPTSVNVSGGNGLRTTWGIGASILPGMMLTDKTMAFARLGVIESHFTSQSKNRLGGQIGLGLQTSVCQNVDVRGEYDYTKYRTVSSGLSAPNMDGFNLGVIYKIA